MQFDINKKILVAYFSYSGNNLEIADQIHKNVGGDIFEIQSLKPYPDDYDTVVQQAVSPAKSARPRRREPSEKSWSSRVSVIGLVTLTWLA